MLKLTTLLSVPYTGHGISYTCGEFLRNTSREFETPELFSLYSTKKEDDFIVNGAVPPLVGRLAFRLARDRLRRLNERKYAARLEQIGGVAYLFGDTSAEFSQWIRGAGVTICREKVNTAKAMTKAIMDAEYERLGLPPSHGITEGVIEEEAARLREADFVFCASEFIEKSVGDYGISADKLIPTARGFDPARLRKDPSAVKAEVPVFLFVGTVCIRKGVHRLISNWEKSGVNGRLLLVGKIEPEFEKIYGHLFDVEGVEHIPYTNEIAKLYHSSDVFVLPSFEEGSPKVVYEACYSGLPCIVSPMGAGRVVKDGRNGRVLDPLDADAWIEAIRTMANDAEQRSQMGATSHEIAKDFTWEKVGLHRTQELARRLQLAHA